MTSAQAADAARVPDDGERSSPQTISFTLPTVEHTLALGRAIGQRLGAGDLVILTGSLGAGKTALTKGIGAGMRVIGTVMSPTFVIARVHAGDVPLVHVDAYRLTGTVELDDLDLDTDLGRSAVVVEWGEGVAEQLTDQRLIVALERRPDDTRIARLTPVGADWGERLRGLPEVIAPGA
ncbi:MAG TPA: tRNA (adenosine(37)-N6)-threonylcarbamoyltransferase complex ATPase subunit type 1 TsaE [Nakamurella sp.]|nr:tRNA (adenosine(37)-N6)-threonylcarbamoyltransferase complex ATPase subunit type 1 TsaE [Nakamurella sp.]